VGEVPGVWFLWLRHGCPRLNENCTSTCRERATIQGIVSCTHRALQQPYDVRLQSGMPMSALNFGNSTCFVGRKTDTAAKGHRHRRKAPRASPTKVRPVHPLPCVPDAPAHSCSLQQSDKDEPNVVASPGRLRAESDPTSEPAPRRSRNSICDERRLTALTVQGQTWKSLCRRRSRTHFNETDRDQWHVQLQPRALDRRLPFAAPSEPCSECPSPAAQVQHPLRLCGEVRNNRV